MSALPLALAETGAAAAGEAKVVAAMAAATRSFRQSTRRTPGTNYQEASIAEPISPAVQYRWFV